MPTARDLVRFLLRRGYRKVRQTGSHLMLEHAARKPLVIPVHRGDLPKGLFLRILKDAGFTLQEFREG
ncbi:MAG: type II toxin-antitoxin system HicA family toxin [Acidobacteria bacterium]|nr:type II toxin-antitoxin system HicA family toxin [Acidobacteriota bacterium]